MHKDYIKSSVFGFEDSLVSTTGVIIGVAIGTSNRDFIILAAFVTIAVEALSMGAGQFLSERTLHELDPKAHKDSLTIGALAMFVSYFLGGLIPVLPVIFIPLPLALYFTVIFSFLGLFTLGYVKGKITGVSASRSAIEMLVIGGLAAIVGITAGLLLKV
jgi:vacuolar iron transporter family protein